MPAAIEFKITPRDRLSIVLGNKPTLVEKTASRELNAYLRKLLKTDTIAITDDISGKSILLGTPASSPIIKSMQVNLGLKELKEQGFVVTPSTYEDKDVLVIAGNDGRGVLYGTYAFLEEIGIGFAPPGCGVDDKIPELKSIVFEKSLREEPAFNKRGGYHLMGWQKEVLFNKTTFYDGDVLKYLPEYLRGLDWMARHRLNVRILWLFWGGQEPTTTRHLWSKENEKVDSAICGFISYRDYPKLRWEEKYGQQLERNRKMLREIIAYGKERGIDIVVWTGGEIGYPGTLLEQYPELKKGKHELCAANPETWKYVKSRTKEFFEMFPDLGGYMYSVAADCGVSIAKVLQNCKYCETIPRPKRLAMLAQTILDAKNEAGSQAEIYYWPWGPCSIGFDPLERWPAPWRDTPRLNVLLPPEVIIHNRASMGEPQEDFNMFNPWVGKFTRHRETVGFHFYHEHHGVGAFPVAYIEGTWKEMANYYKKVGAWGMLGEMGWEPGLVDPTGVNLGYIDYYSFARLAWNPNYDPERIWREWAEIFFPEARDEAIDILKGSYERMFKMYYTRAGQRLPIPPRTRFDRFTPKQLLEYNDVPLRELGLALIQEKEEVVQSIDGALRKLQNIKSKLGPNKYECWQKNLAEQRKLTLLFKNFLAACSYYWFIKRGLEQPGDRETLKKILAEILLLSKSLDLPPKILMTTFMEWDLSHKLYEPVFANFVAECKKILKTKKRECIDTSDTVIFHHW